MFLAEAVRLLSHLTVLPRFVHLRELHRTIIFTIRSFESPHRSQKQKTRHEGGF
jgi:hypothetical protein